MGRQPNRSRQTRLVLGVLAESQRRWWHGYELAKAVSLKSGTLYPILIRLHDQGMLEAEWRTPEVMGRPSRHMYRLTAAGAALAAELASEENASSAPRPLLSPT